jgi:hypothetical protein
LRRWLTADSEPQEPEVNEQHSSADDGQSQEVNGGDDRKEPPQATHRDEEA